MLPNDRAFDPLDVVANVVGSLAALGVCNWYHKRMAERRRVRKYGVVPGEDVELGGLDDGGQEVGVVMGGEEEEEEEDWDELDGGGGGGDSGGTIPGEGIGNGNGVKV